MHQQKKNAPQIKDLLSGAKSNCGGSNCRPAVLFLENFQMQHQSPPDFNTMYQNYNNLTHI
jgi:hypothetical protein